MSLSVTGPLCQRGLSLNDAVSRYLNPGLWSFYSVVQYNNDDKVVVIKCIPLVRPSLAIPVNVACTARAWVNLRLVRDKASGTMDDVDRVK